jgi:hypothetical protein
MQVDDTKRYINYADSNINYYQSNVISSNEGVNYWSGVAKDMNQKANDYMQSNLQTFQPGWDLVNA